MYCHMLLLTVVAATQSSTYATSQAASYAVPGASPYATAQTVVTPGAAYAAPSGEQQYAQPAIGQPGNVSLCCASGVKQASVS